MFFRQFQEGGCCQNSEAVTNEAWIISKGFQPQTAGFMRDGLFIWIDSERRFCSNASGVNRVLGGREDVVKLCDAWKIKINL